MTDSTIEPDDELAAVVNLLHDKQTHQSPQQLQAAAREWLAADFDAEEILAWLQADCASPAHARQLEDAGITAEQAATMIDEPDEVQTSLAHKFVNGEISLSEARRIVTRLFWNE